MKHKAILMNETGPIFMAIITAEDWGIPVISALTSGRSKAGLHRDRKVHFRSAFISLSIMPYDFVNLPNWQMFSIHIGQTDKALLYILFLLRFILLLFSKTGNHYANKYLSVSSFLPITYEKYALFLSLIGISKILNPEENHINS